MARRCRLSDLTEQPPLGTPVSESVDALVIDEVERGRRVRCCTAFVRAAGEAGRCRPGRLRERLSNDASAMVDARLLGASREAQPCRQQARWLWVR
jgi:hypothetical protein